MRLKVVSLWVLALVLLAAGCAPAAQPTPTPAPVKVTFMAGYKAQADLPFLAAYVAKEKGFFLQQGLDVEVRHSAGSGEHFKLLASNDVQFTTATADDVLKLRADPGLPIMAVALFGQRGDRGFAVLKRSGITSVKGFEGKTVGYKVFVSPDYVAMLKVAGVDRNKVKEVPVGFDPRVLTEGQVDVYPVFVSNEPDTIQSKLGQEVTVFQPADFGVPTLGLTYVVTESYLKEHKDIVMKFVRATLKALDYAFNNEEDALNIVMKYAPNEERPHQQYMMRTEKAAALTDLTRTNGLGWMTLQQWQALSDSLLAYQGIAKAVEVPRAFDDSILKGIYKSGKLVWP